MSELKAGVMRTPHNEGMTFDRGSSRIAVTEDETEFYLKSEVDKVIAELKKERDWLAKDRAQAYDDLEKRAQLNIKHEESERHQKYKRCLAMARWCMARYNEWCAFYPTTTTKEMKFLEKWEKRWRKLADKFKEAKCR